MLFNVRIFIKYFFPLISYFINHYTKTTSWEDPRIRYQQIGKATSKENKPDNSSSSNVVQPPEHPENETKEKGPALAVLQQGKASRGTMPPRARETVEHSMTRKGNQITRALPC